ncbi:MAG: hypothetical protein N4A35_00665 [Flavobacteriales bacterium]|nr:hypothetical protein [Flavobacteriales bacterium]
MIENISFEYWAFLILTSATIFSLLWGLDAVTHKRLVEIDITDKELQTHRNILIASGFMELSLVIMYWWDIEVLPFFIAALVVRLTHEFIDELHFHTDRCTPYESNLHLGMWITVFIKTVSMFIWGFFTNYEGIDQLPFFYYVWGVVVLIVMAYISFVEWKRGFSSFKDALLAMIRH